MNSAKKKLEALLPSDETIRERKQQWEELFRVFNDDSVNETIDFKSVGMNISPEEEKENDLLVAETDECESETGDESENEMSASELKKFELTIRPIIQKRIRRWEANSEYDWCEEIVAKDGSQKNTRASIRKSSKHSEELFNANSSKVLSETSNICKPFDHLQIGEIENGKRYYRKVTTTTKVEEVIRYDYSNDHITPYPKSTPKKSLKHKNNENWASMEMTEKPKRNYPAIKGPEVVAYTPKKLAIQSKEVKICGRKIQKNLIEQGIEDVVIEKSIIASTSHKLVLTPGSKKKEIDSAITKNSGEDLFKRLGRLDRACLKEKLIELND